MKLENEEKCTYCREYGNLPCDECNKKLEEKKAMYKTKCFIDLSKCSEEQIENIYNTVKETEFIKPNFYTDKDFMMLKFCTIEERWGCSGKNWDGLKHKTELTYPEFIKLFEGGKKYDGWIKIESEADLPKKGTDCHVFFKTGVQTIFNNIDDLEILTLLNRCSHYMPIIKPLPPRF